MVAYIYMIRFEIMTNSYRNVVGCPPTVVLEDHNFHQRTDHEPLFPRYSCSL